MADCGHQNTIGILRISDELCTCGTCRLGSRRGGSSRGKGLYWSQWHPQSPCLVMPFWLLPCITVRSLPGSALSSNCMTLCPLFQHCISSIVINVAIQASDDVLVQHSTDLVRLLGCNNTISIWAVVNIPVQFPHINYSACWTCSQVQATAGIVGTKLGVLPTNIRLWEPSWMCCQ